MSFLKNQAGIAMVMELALVGVVIAVVAIVAIKVTGSHAGTRCYTVLGRQHCIIVPSSSGATAGSQGASGSRGTSTCTQTVNGVTTTYTSTGGCSSNVSVTSTSQGSSSSTTAVGQGTPGTPGVTNQSSTTTTSQGTPGTSTCTVHNSDGTTTTVTGTGVSSCTSH